jgi:hypothetical protein
MVDGKAKQRSRKYISASQFPKALLCKMHKGNGRREKEDGMLKLMNTSQDTYAKYAVFNRSESSQYART